MNYRTELLKMIDKFNVESVEEFKEAENKIVADSKFRQITKKKDYSGHINQLRNVKKKSQKIDPKSVKIPESDKEAIELRKSFEKNLVIFSGVCDSYIQLQTALKEKAEGSEMKFGSYKELNDKVRYARSSLNSIMHEMDILYSNFVEFIEGDKEEDFGGIEYKTYDSFL
ncbi:MAG: hypothetical protein PHS19_02650 [Eubacteriales bacterium]|nr:hypothetical protein [Eubacteriales bacterium]